MHTGGYVDHRGAGYPSFYLDYHVGNGIVTQSQLTSMVAGGLFEEVPGLRVVMTECGRRLGGGAALVAGRRLGADARRPSRGSRAARRSTSTSTSGSPPSRSRSPADPQHLMYAIEQAHLRDKLLFATDYPHWDFDSPTQALPRVIDKELRHGDPVRQRTRPLRLCPAATDARRGRSPGLMSAHTYEPGAVDCDVHVAPAAYADLLPYLATTGASTSPRRRSA